MTRWLWASLLSLGCVHPGKEDDTNGDDTSADTADDTGATFGAPTPEGCTAGDGPATTISAALTDIATVVRVSWEADADGYVSFTTPTGPLRTPTTGPGHHEALLVGNRARTDVSFRVISLDGSEVWCGESLAITTGAFDAGLPELGLATDPALAGAAIYTVVPVFDTDNTWLTILDPEGAYIWAWRDTLFEQPASPKVFRAAMSDSYDGVLGNHESQGTDDPGTLFSVGFDGTTRDVARPLGTHTDFVQLGDGGYATLVWQIQEIAGRMFLGDGIVEVDSAGQSRTVWSAFDSFTPDLEVSYPKGFYHPDPEVEDWTHVNGIDYDPDEEAFFISIPVNDSVARVERASGQLTWDLADLGGDFTPVGAGPLVSFPHSVQNLGGSILVFNRGEVDQPGHCSSANEIAYDTVAGTAQSIWSFTSPDCLQVPFLGEARRLTDGSTMVVWTTSGRIDRATPSGEISWQVNLKIGAAFGFASFVDTLYPPA